MNRYTSSIAAALLWLGAGCTSTTGNSLDDALFTPEGPASAQQAPGSGPDPSACVNRCTQRRQSKQAGAYFSYLFCIESSPNLSAFNECLDECENGPGECYGSEIEWCAQPFPVILGCYKTMERAWNAAVAEYEACVEGCYGQ